MKFNRFIPLLLFILVLTTGVILAPHIGVAWDEPDNIVAGGTYWKFFTHGFDQSILTSGEDDASLFAGEIFSQEPSIARYPPVPNYVGTALAVAGKAMGFVMIDTEIISAFHIASAIFFAILIAYVWRWCVLLGMKKQTSVAVALTAFLFPTLFGHGYSNIKDSAQVALFTVSLYYFVRMGKERSVRDGIIGSVVWGLALATKMNAVYVPIIAAAWFLVARPPLPTRLNAVQLPYVLRLGFAGALLGIIGLVSMVAVWPYLWVDTISRTQEVIAYFTTVGQGYRVFWNGTLIQVGAGQIWWWYPWANLWIVTPPLVLVLTLVGAGVLCIGQMKRYRSMLEDIEIDRSLGLVMILWVIIPFLRSFMPQAAFYDGVRHFMETLPAVVIIAWVGALFLWSRILRLAPQVRRHARLLEIASAGFIIGPLLVVCVTYFPYSTGYYNVFAADPNTFFDRDIEGLSVKEGVEYLKSTYGNIRLWAPVSGHQSWYYVTTDDRYVYNEYEADSIILVNKSSHARQPEFHAQIADMFVIDHIITRGDAVFAWVYRRK